jgi:hypothetical protein
MVRFIFIAMRIKFLDSESQNCKFAAHSGLKSDTIAMYLVRANGSAVASSLLSPLSCPTYVVFVLGRRRSTGTVCPNSYRRPQWPRSCTWETSPTA